MPRLFVMSTDEDPLQEHARALRSLEARAPVASCRAVTASLGVPMYLSGIGDGHGAAVRDAWIAVAAALAVIGGIESVVGSIVWIRAGRVLRAWPGCV